MTPLFVSRPRGVIIRTTYVDTEQHTENTTAYQAPRAGTMGQLALFTEWLPKRPYCTDALGQLRILPAVQVLQRRYIQPNTPWDLRWLVYDVDRATAYSDWWDTPRCPGPSIIVCNRENGHCHFLYALTVPVYTQPEAQQGPLRFAAAVDVALTMVLGADPGYAGLLCKNVGAKSIAALREFLQSKGLDRKA